MPEDNSTRDRVRALVRDVLSKIPEAPRAAEKVPAPTAEPVGPSSRFVNQIPEAAPASASFTRDESSKTVITEADVRGLAPGAKLRIGQDARLTPLAADIVREQGIELVRRRERRGPGAARLIAVGCDHGGFKMKEDLKVLLGELGHRVQDFGTNSEEAVDYPDYAYAVARAVSEKAVELGIVIDGAGVGSAITANKVPGVRAAACYSVEVARNSREHNDANVLSLGSKTITHPQMREIVAAWLGTDITEDRHKKRVAKIIAIERQYSSNR